MKSVLAFLTNLSANNHREWLDENRTWYEQSRQEVLQLTDALIQEIRKFDSEFPPLMGKDCLFRINRDVRFSSHKEPYKTHFGSYMAPGGRKSIKAGYYFHIDPVGCFMGGGIYMPDANVLKAIRYAISDNPDHFRELTENDIFKATYPVREGKSLKTAPKGFPKDADYIDLIRYKSYAFTAGLDVSNTSAIELVKTIGEAFRILQPVNQFLNEAIDQYA